MTRYLHNYDKDYAFGGNTFAMEIVDGRLFVGVAHCSDKDQYVKTIGRDIATSYLDELKHAYRTSGVECVTIGTDIPKMGKITGFVVNDDVMYNIIVTSYNENFYAVSSHIEIEVKNIDYMAIEGAELKDMLIKFYNEIVYSMFEEVDVTTLADYSYSSF